jgi:hypothetical protein
MKDLKGFDKYLFDWISSDCERASIARGHLGLFIERVHSEFIEYLLQEHRNDEGEEADEDYVEYVNDLDFRFAGFAFHTLHTAEGSFIPHWQDPHDCFGDDTFWDDIDRRLSILDCYQCVGGMVNGFYNEVLKEGLKGEKRK